MATTGKTSLSDTPFRDDVNDFGTERYVNGLIEFIRRSSAPITIALQGEWGSGKTSLMTRLERELCSEGSQFIGVEINTWEHSMLSSPEMTVFKILEHLVKKLTKDDFEVQSKFKKLIKSAGRILYSGARGGARLTPGVGDTLGLAMDTAVAVSELALFGDDSEKATLSEVKKSLEKAVGNIIKKAGKSGVIVFVDDLDRLNPPVAVEILELMKNIFCIENCIFVLAIDYEVVVKGLEPKFGKLTDKNEREFRSFFDKIIQVPFSLPVNSYRPMNFVLDSLVRIDYITAVEKQDDRLRKPIKQIVEYSVGKNPRSIKRLINTLSLLSCIAKCGQDEDTAFVESCGGRIVNFAIVAIQVCYPRIYRMLVNKPAFTDWDHSLLVKMNIAVADKNKEQFQDWEDVLEAACQSDPYLTQHFNDIQSLLIMIKESMDDSLIAGKETFEDKIRSIIDKSSVTGISEPNAVAEVDRKRLVDRLHQNVEGIIRKNRPDINNFRRKNNTGNGGFFIGLPGDRGNVEIIIRPRVAPDKIACELKLATTVKRTEAMMGKSWDEMLQNERLRKAFDSFDRVVSPLLESASYFEGSTYPETAEKIFKSFSAEQAYRSNQGWHPVDISQNVSYWINLQNEALFEDKAVVKAMADVVMAAYDYRKATMDL